MSGVLRAIHAEWLRVVSLRTWWVLALVLVGYVGVTAGGLAFFVSSMGDTEQGALPPLLAAELVYSSTTAVALVIPLLFGALQATTEYRWHTLTPTFLAQPRRGVVLTGRLVIALVMGAVYGVIGAGVSVAAGASVLVATGGEAMLDDPDIQGLLLRTVVACALWSLLGLGVGALLTSQIAAIVIVLAFTQFVEPILRVVAPVWEWSAQIGRFLPGAATDALVGAGLLMSIGALDPTAPQGGAEPLTILQGGLVLAGLSLLAVVIASLTTLRRDVD